MATSRVDHTVENLEAGQRDSIRRAKAKAGGAKPKEYNNLPSDAEVNQAESERLADASSDGESEEKKEAKPKRGPGSSPPASGEPPQPPAGKKQG